MKIARYLLIAALAAGLLAAGCGGDDDDGGGGEALTQEEFESKANEVCQGARDRYAEIQNDVQKRLSDDPGQAQQVIEDLAGELSSAVKETLNQVDDLTPPEDLQSKLDEFVAKGNELADKLQGDPAEFAQELQQGGSVLEDVSRLASDLGLEICVPGGGGGGGGTTGTGTSTTGAGAGATDGG